MNILKSPLLVASAKGKSCITLAMFFGALASAQEPTVRLAGNVSSAVAQARRIGAVENTQEIEFALTLPLRNRAELEALLKRLYTPGDLLYRRYLQTGEFTERFGPRQADYDAVIAFAK